ncbi:hypothetical protein K466DRAFT_40803 [Polyporus arcularius HHB13444]|uniref:Uncharacterized protein n=1 Tax=Polyporus arcularius HHB13444 TaxID=1314778 RepID=A0A5C3PJC0_9APHY|nr:hypothetical protein K466DRAFT_40803 [Polyporus arcularius HHB13444]
MAVLCLSAPSPDIRHHPQIPFFVCTTPFSTRLRTVFSLRRFCVPCGPRDASTLDSILASALPDDGLAYVCTRRCTAPRTLSVIACLYLIFQQVFSAGSLCVAVGRVCSLSYRHPDTPRSSCSCSICGPHSDCC